jgi:hypothetical protein
MPARKQAPPLTVAELLGKCQETTGSHSKYAGMLWEIEAADSDACFKDLIRCLSYLLTVPLVGALNKKTSALAGRIYSYSSGSKKKRLGRFTPLMPSRMTCLGQNTASVRK